MYLCGPLYNIRTKFIVNVQWFRVNYNCWSFLGPFNRLLLSEHLLCVKGFGSISKVIQNINIKKTCSLISWHIGFVHEKMPNMLQILYRWFKLNFSIDRLVFVAEILWKKAALLRRFYSFLIWAVKDGYCCRWFWKKLFFLFLSYGMKLFADSVTFVDVGVSGFYKTNSRKTHFQARSQAFCFCFSDKYNTLK